MRSEVLKELLQKNDSKILFLIMDGLGGLPMEPGGKTELETARTPNFDKFAAQGICGMLDPVHPGITPGSGPAHLGLFGYDPLEFDIGRGVLSALGVDFPLTDRDVAVRLNFCTTDENDIVLDRRAGRIPTELNERLCEKIRKRVKLSNGVQYFLETESEHRAVLILRGDGLGGNVTDTDPQQTGVRWLPPRAEDEASRRTVKYVNEWLQQVREVLKDESPANMVLMRGFAKHEPLPGMEERYGLKSCAIAQYPMYRGLARLVGMEVLPRPETYQEMWQQLRENYGSYDFFFIHFKKTDSSGEDGDFNKKVKIIEEVDGWASKLFDLNPDVVVITGDHSTPALLKTHSWHPVPVVLWSKFSRADEVGQFGERYCNRGYLGRMPAQHLILIALANALRLKKYGA